MIVEYKYSFYVKVGSIMKKNYITNISEFLKTIKELENICNQYRVGYNPTNVGFLYRGMDDNYPLLPGVLRKTFDENKNHKYALGSELGMLRHFIQEASPIINLNSKEYVRWLEIAQHYGMPTRLLDWTENPLVALFFACIDKRQKDGTLWILHKPNYAIWKDTNNEQINKSTFEDNIFNLISRRDCSHKYPFLYTPYYFDTRMSAQSSWFMVWGTEELSFEDMLNDDCYISQTKKTDMPGNFAHKLYIKSCDKQRIMRELDTCGINSKTLFPGLEGVGKYIEWKYHFDNQEMFDIF